jgi:hypothetical protein
MAAESFSATSLINLPLVVRPAVATTLPSGLPSGILQITLLCWFLEINALAKVGVKLLEMHVLKEDFMAATELPLIDLAFITGHDLKWYDL